ncbi:hypothetical protein AG1IA_02233 [Rhizoctonia solani AG-1 IA]|uniref:Uncharacterized protein n=1 Tax=Thanatephorus cucumeris (strain AG1-IA) TaxID=983506 RepID=L8X3Z3_THACA|nr:hypothetical protein AG1IA_02233 [Rhizoctonia solani AG-1 IA]
MIPNVDISRLITTLETPESDDYYIPDTLSRPPSGRQAYLTLFSTCPSR